MADAKSSTASLLSTEFVQDHLRRASQGVSACAAADFIEYHEVQFRCPITPFEIESPLEAVFFIWWTALVKTCHNWELKCLEIQPQEWVDLEGSRYRIDFSIKLRTDDGGDGMGSYIDRMGIPWKPIAVEVDGHAFHEKTPEQVARRNERDRALQNAGWTVFHFSFSEMNERPDDCVYEVYAFAKRQVAECHKAAVGRVSPQVEP
jgi:very-short-patch-repair endonuclease